MGASIGNEHLPRPGGRGRAGAGYAARPRVSHSPARVSRRVWARSHSQIEVERREEGGDAGGEVVTITQKDPVQRRDLLGHGCRFGVAHDDRHDALAASGGVLDLLATDRRRSPVRADDDQEGIGGIDRCPHLRHPLGRRRDALPIDPSLASRLGQCSVKAPHDLTISA